MNNFTGVGRLTKDATTDSTKSGTAVASFRLAIDGPNGNTDFLPVKVYGKYAESIGQYLTRGKLISLTGRVNHNTWVTEDGSNRERLEIVANNIQFLDSPKSE